MDSFSPDNCQYTFTAQHDLRAIKLKKIKKLKNKFYQARINVEVLRLMLKYEAVQKVTEQAFMDTPTSLVSKVALS